MTSAIVVIHLIFDSSDLLLTIKEIEPVIC